jgi:hypothetical protein
MTLQDTDVERGDQEREATRPTMHLVHPSNRGNFQRSDTASTKVEKCRPCRSISVSMPTDIVEVAEVPRCQCVPEPEVLGEKLEITDKEREKLPPFCDVKKIISGRGEQLIYVGWNGPDDPANPRNWKPKTKWFLSVVC